jgi:ribosomal subunit interface protein
MHVHFTYLHVPKTPQLDQVIERHIQKLEKLLAHFSPDLVHLRGALESNGTHSNTVCSLNLALPTGQIHARQEGKNLMTDLQACFSHLNQQLKKHKEGLRREEDWKRQRGPSRTRVEAKKPVASRKK